MGDIHDTEFDCIKKNTGSDFNILYDTCKHLCCIHDHVEKMQKKLEDLYLLLDERLKKEDEQ